MKFVGLVAISALIGCSSAGGGGDGGEAADAFVGGPADGSMPGFDATFDSSTPEVFDAAIPDATPPPDVLNPPDASTTRPGGFGAPTPTTQFGNLTGGTPFEDACPSGQALVGFAGAVSNSSTTAVHNQIGALCGKVERFGEAGSYAIHVSPGASLPTRGINPGVSWERKCGTDQLISGFVGRAGQLVDQLVFSCVPILVDAQNGTSISFGAVTVLPLVGGTTGGSPFAQTDCPAGQVATVARVRAGDGIDAFGLACGVPSVTP